jgi:hypothetical protein
MIKLKTKREDTLKHSIGLVVTAVAMTSVISGLHATTALANPGGSADLIESMAGQIAAEAMSVEVKDTSKSVVTARHIEPMATDASIKDFVAKEKAMADSAWNVGGEAMNRRGRRSGDDAMEASHADAENVSAALENAKKIDIAAKAVDALKDTNSYSVEIIKTEVAEKAAAAEKVINGEKLAAEAAAAEMATVAKIAAEAAVQQAAEQAAKDAAEAAAKAAAAAAAEAAAQAAAQAAAEAAAAAAKAAAEQAAKEAADAAAKAAADAAAKAAAEKEAADAIKVIEGEIKGGIVKGGKK